MRFHNPEELVEFFNTLDLEKSTLVFKEEKESFPRKKPCACEGKSQCQCPPKKQETPVEEGVVQISDASNKAIVESFAENPSFELVVSEDVSENLFFVTEYEAIENACGTGRVEIGDSTVFMNMCEVNNKATVHLDVVVEGKRMHNVPFTLCPSHKKPYLVISKNQLV